MPRLQQQRWSRCVEILSIHAHTAARLFQNNSNNGARPAQAQLDGVTLPAATAAGIDETQMLPMIEDELDAGSHSWAGGARQAAGLPSVSSQAQAAISVPITVGGAVTGPPHAATLPASVRSLLLASPLAGGVSSNGGGGDAREAAWQLAGSAAAYAQERMRHMGAMLAAPGLRPQPVLAM